jgi:hypothetical protein
VKVTPPGVAPSAVPAPVTRGSTSSATKTIFGVPTPGQSGSYTASTQASATPSPAPVGSASPAIPSVIVDDKSSKTGARKTSVPAPEVSAAPAAAEADDPAATRSGYGSAPAAEAPKRPPVSAPAAAPRPAPAPAPAAAAAEKTSVGRRETPIWTYVGVGVIFGASLIGIYQLVGLLAH